MAARSVLTRPTLRQLRQFGAVCLCALPLLGWLWGASGRMLAGLCVVGILLALLSAFRPRLVEPVFLAATLIAWPIGLMVGELALLLVFLTVFLPMGLVFRCLGRDALQRTWDRGRDSYWQPKAQPRSLRQYYRRW